ncbi:augurin-B [Astyanax mexicanus]|uniref:augurin-B n=1 Tax=Astyanax mexicanus TaxID=7994 RepID=UPI0020CAAC4D|nr:augurin-B [Astyanax mexicanus]
MVQLSDTFLHTLQQVLSRNVSVGPEAPVEPLILHECLTSYRTFTPTGQQISTMKLHSLSINLLLFLVFLNIYSPSGAEKGQDGSSPNILRKLLKKREALGQSRPEAEVVVSQVKAKEFLSAPQRPRRNLWDRSRPDVQQWIQQFMYMGYDEARLETDLAHWMDHARANDQGRQHHYDENAAMGPRDANAYRHGANVNYDYY